MQRLLPPLLFLPLLVASVVVGLVVPVLGPTTWAIRALGVPVAAVGLTLNLGGAGLFNRIGTNVKTFDDPGRLVTGGPFRFTRNPMYLGFTSMLCGAALLVGTLTAWIGAVAFFVAANLW
ncbi:MAG: methyltransferase, partial [Actinomycetota bacterium]